MVYDRSVRLLRVILAKTLRSWCSDTNCSRYACLTVNRKENLGSFLPMKMAKWTI